MARCRSTRRSLLRRCGLAVATLAGCAAGGTTRVAMAEGLVFDPERLSVAAGTTVRWTNEGDTDHTVTAYGDRIPADAAYFASGGFASERAAREDVTGGLVRPGERYEHTFERPGAYAYFCIPHERAGMTGTVVVE